MPNFTIELFRVLEFRSNIGLDIYPIFQESYRASLNDKIIKHYYNREIGHETVDLFVFAMRRKMNEIMPYYNQLYKSAQIQFDPLVTMDLRTITTGENEAVLSGTSTSHNTGENNSSSRAVQSQTPQVMLSPDGDYATSGADSNSKGTSVGDGEQSSDSTSNESSNGESHVTGYQGAPAELINSYRGAIINTDMLIIDQLSELFMGVWENGSDILPYHYTDLPAL